MGKLSVAESEVRKVSLLDIAERLGKALLALNNEEIDEQAILDTIEGIEGEMGDKIARVLKFIETVELCAAQQEATRKHYADKAAFWSAKRKVNDSLVNRLKQYIIGCLEMVGITKGFQAGDQKVSIRKPVQVVKITDITKIPDQFFKRDEESLMKDQIKEKLKAGESVPGAELVDGKKSLVLS
jgi:hypothetical protein